MAHIAINISKPYTFDKIMSASELMLYTNISNYLVDGVDMNTILSALAEFTDGATFHPVIISQENMFQEWDGVNYVDTVKATGQNIEVEIGDNKVISSLHNGPGEWIIQDVQTGDDTVRGLEWKNIYPSVDRFYKDENEEWQPIDNDDYHENVKYVFHSLQPRGIKRIKIENGDFTDGNSIDLYKSFDSENQGDHLSVNLESKKETFALYSKEFYINTIEEGEIYKEDVPSVVSLSPRCDSSALYNSGNNLFSNIVDSNSFLLAATDDEYVDYPDYASINFGGEFKGGAMSFTGLLDIDIKNIGIHKIENDEEIEGVINNINIFDNILCLNSRSSVLLKDGDISASYTKIVSKLGKSNLISNNLKLKWSDNTQDIVDVFIKNYSMNISKYPMTNDTETIEQGINNILTSKSINNKCVFLSMGGNDPSKELIDGMYFASIEISSDVDYALLSLTEYYSGYSGTRILKLSYSNNERSMDVLNGDVIEYSKTNGVASCMILNRHRPRFKNSIYKHINIGSVDTILSGKNKFMLYSRIGQTYIEEGEKKYSAYITIDENASSMLLYYDETNRPSLKVFYGLNGLEGEDVPTGGIVDNFEYIVVASSQGYVNYNGRNYYNGDTFSGVGGNKNYDAYNGAKVQFRKKSVILPQSCFLKYSKKQDKFGNMNWKVDILSTHRLPSFINYNFDLGIKSQDTELSYTVDSVNGSVTLVPTNINTFGRMREYAIPESVTTEYAVHSIEGGGRNYNPEVMAWLNSTSWYKGNPNYITFEEAAAVDSEQFSGTNNAQKKAIVTFDEAQYFTSVTYLTSTAFQDCDYLRRIILPNTLTEIRGLDEGNGGAFSDCTDLVDVYIPDSVTTIGRCAFDNCSSLALTSLPSGITSIGQNAFRGCGSLALTSLPSGLTTIGQYAFQSCTMLKDTLYEIPSSVMEIGEHAFEFIEFPALKFLGLTPPSFGSWSICALPQKVDCQVPLASLADYQEAMRELTDAGLVTISTY